MAMDLSIRNFVLENEKGQILEMTRRGMYPAFLNPNGLGVKDGNKERDNPKFDLYCKDNDVLTANDQYDLVLKFMSTAQILYLNQYVPTMTNENKYNKVRAIVKLMHLEKTEKKDFDFLICPIEFERLEDWKRTSVNLVELIPNQELDAKWTASAILENMSLVDTSNTIKLHYPCSAPIINFYDGAGANYASMRVNSNLGANAHILIISDKKEHEISIVSGSTHTNMWSAIDRTRDSILFLRPGQTTIQVAMENESTEIPGAITIEWTDAYASI